MSAATEPPRETVRRTLTPFSRPAREPRERERQARKIAPRVRIRPVDGAARRRAVHRRAVPAEEVLGLVAAKRPGRERPQDRMHARRAVAGGEDWAGADRLGDDEQPLLGPPERGLAPALQPQHGEGLER